MIIVKLMGGLGNQMFQYAAAKSLAGHLRTSFKLDTTFLLDRTPKENFVYRDFDLDIFNINPGIATKEETDRFTRKPSSALAQYLAWVKNKIWQSKYYFEPHFHFTPDFFKLPANCYLDGYWQSPKYFTNVEKELRIDFSFNESIQRNSLKLHKSILEQTSVCVNVRRADFLSNAFHGVCDMKYFAPAIEIVASRINNPHFFIFSDDPEWCKENIKPSYPVTFVGHEHAGYKFSNYLQLMSQCKHYIIPNSSFAWWAVWLNTRLEEKIVVAPQSWFADSSWNSKDLIPDTWIRVPN